MARATVIVLQVLGILLVGLLTFLVVTVARGDKGAAPPLQASVLGVTSGPGEAAPAGSSAPNAVAVTWQPATLELFKGEEQANPFAVDWPQIPRGRMEWRLYTSSAGAPPRLLYRTRRWLSRPAWSATSDRVSAIFGSRSLVEPGGLDAVSGLIVFNPNDPSESLAEVASQTPAGFWPAPGGSKVALLSSPGTAPSTGLRLLDVETRASAGLNGLSGTLSPFSGTPWSPDGEYLLLFSAGGLTRSQLFLVPAAGGTALPLSSGPAAPAWSLTAPYRLAYIDAGALWVLDPHTGARSRLTTDATFEASSPELVWLPGEQYIQAGNKVAGVADGALITYPSAAKISAYAAVSPDARYVVSADYTLPPMPVSAPQPELCSASARPQNRVYLFDSTTNTNSVLKACDGRSFTRFQWLADGRHLLMEGYDCAQCESPSRRVVLMDVVTGAESALSQGLEFYAWAVPSPDGRRVLVTGNSLRIYDTAGRLIEKIDPPAGLSVTAASWAPDGDHFAYILGPTGVWGH